MCKDGDRGLYSRYYPDICLENGTSFGRQRCSVTHSEVLAITLWRTEVASSSPQIQTFVIIISWAESRQFSSRTLTTREFLLISPFQRHLSLPSGLFLSSFSTTMESDVSLSPSELHCLHIVIRYISEKVALLLTVTHQSERKINWNSKSYLKLRKKCTNLISRSSYRIHSV